MRTTIIIVALGVAYSINCFAAMTGDSVMSPGELAVSPTAEKSTGTYTPPPLSNISTNEFRYGTCPSGFTYQNGTQYPVEVRSISTYYLGGQLAGQSSSAWSDLDTSCTKTEEQSIACPSGYTGNQLQRRTVATKDGRGYDYSAWNTYQNSCVYVPPVTCRFDLWRYMLREDVNQNSVRYSFFTNGSKSASYAGASPTWNGYRAGKLNRTDYFQDGGDSGNTIGYTNYYEICGPF